jgi:lytic murein transglycosylase
VPSHAPRSPAVLLSALLLIASPYARGEEFAACLKQVRSEAAAKGVRGETFDRALSGIEPDQSVLDAMAYQPEFKVPIWDYLAGLVDEERVVDGHARLVQWAKVLDAVERKFGVDRHAVVAVWGVESDYGRIMGRRPVVRSLATVSCFGHRQRFFRSELIATLRIIESGDIETEALVGSWAGAFGQTQFMPSTFLRLAIDFDGDGRRDIVGSVPDALGSTANYLARAGWRTGEPWGYEVRLPRDYKGPAGRRDRRPLDQWAALGVRRIDGRPLTGSGAAALLLPAGAAGPALLVFRNFDAIYAYNQAESYALAIALLSDRLRGSAPLATPWPTDDPGLSRAERRELQAHLMALGHDLGIAEPNGIVGPRTRAALQAFQAAAGFPADGRAGVRVLNALRAQERAGIAGTPP